jgi:dihydropyrimidinase
VLPEGETRADLLLENGVISAVGQDLTGDRVIDAAGKLIFPGFIDAHTHFEMNKGLPNETADDFVSGTRAAVSGGTTTILDFATQDGATPSPARWRPGTAGRGRLRLQLRLPQAITDWNDRTRREMADMTAAGVTSYKIYLAYDNLRVSDAAAFEILCAAGEQGALVSAHCENGDLVREGVARQKALGHLAPFAHPLSRPEGVEEEAVRRFLGHRRGGRAAGLRGPSLHIPGPVAGASLPRPRPRGLSGDLSPILIVE